MNRYQAELYHYGVKGMHWGIRRSREELKFNKSSVIASVNRAVANTITKKGIKLTSFSDHAGERAQERKITAKSIIDAVKKPLYISNVVADKEGRPSQRFIGEFATVSINPQTGVIGTIWPTGTKKRNKYKHGGK